MVRLAKADESVACGYAHDHLIPAEGAELALDPAVPFRMGDGQG